METRRRPPLRPGGPSERLDQRTSDLPPRGSSVSIRKSSSLPSTNWWAGRAFVGTSALQVKRMSAANLSSNRRDAFHAAVLHRCSRHGLPGRPGHMQPSATWPAQARYSLASTCGNVQPKVRRLRLHVTLACCSFGAFLGYLFHWTSRLFGISGTHLRVTQPDRRRCSPRASTGISFP